MNERYGRHPFIYISQKHSIPHSLFQGYCEAISHVRSAKCMPHVKLPLRKVVRPPCCYYRLY